MYQYDLRILYTLTGNKSFGSLINISPFESQYMVYWSKSMPLELEDQINLTLDGCSTADNCRRRKLYGGEVENFSRIFEIGVGGFII